MPRQFGKVDVSATWQCKRCPHKHAPLTLCPPVGVWLILTFCKRCDPKNELYCAKHRDRTLPPPREIPPPPGDDEEYLRRIGEEGAA